MQDRFIASPTLSKERPLFRSSTERERDKEKESQRASAVAAKKERERKASPPSPQGVHFYSLWPKEKKNGLIFRGVHWDKSSSHFLHVWELSCIGSNRFHSLIFLVEWFLICSEPRGSQIKIRGEPLFGKYFISRRAPKWFVLGRFQSHVTICVQKIASRRKKCCPMNFRWQNKESLPEFIAADHCQQYPSLCWPDHYLAKVIRKQTYKAGCDTWLRMQIQVLAR